MIVRPATASDWPTVASLLAELGRPDAAGDDALERGFLSYLSRDDTVALVAEEEGEVMGFANLEFRPRLAFSAPQAWVPDLIVREAARSRGAGAALLARAEELSRERGCWSITLESAQWRTRAHAFYRREGWAGSGLSFTKSLDGSVWPPPPRD